MQVPDDDSQWGYYLTDGDQSWDGGIGIAKEWTTLHADDPRITDADREELDHLLPGYGLYWDESDPDNPGYYCHRIVGGEA